MKLKLDENLGSRGKTLLETAGHDVKTVAEQNLTKAEDTDLIEACRSERRCLVTLDLDFGNPLRFNPSYYCGIAVLGLPAKPSHEDLLDAVQTLAAALESESIDQQLWIASARACVSINQTTSTNGSQL